MRTDHFNPWVYLCISRHGTCDGLLHVALFPQNGEQIFCVCYYGWWIRWCTPAASRPQMWHPEGLKDAAQPQNKWITGEAVYKTAPYLAVKRCDGVKTHHLSMSPLMTWQDAGTASLESGILTEGSWSWWRCGAAVNSGYRLVRDGGREGGRKEERHRRSTVSLSGDGNS